MADQSPLEQFKQVLTGTSRAIAHEPEVELAFTADAPTQVGKNFRVPMPGRLLPPDQVAEARGFADGMALRLRHHNDGVHMANRPPEAVAGAVFDAIESARVEAIGSRAMEGVRVNLGHALDMRMRSDPIARAQAADEVPLPTAVGLLVRERLTGDAAPPAAQAGLDMVRGWIEEKAGEDLDALSNALDDQGRFAQLAQKLLRDLELTANPDEIDPTDSNDQSEDEQEGEGEQDQDQSEEGDSQA
ncbi:MAG: cobaltochelatase subunit CobT, partial [Alphaproteobacteria bacterium PA3]